MRRTTMAADKHDAAGRQGWLPDADRVYEYLCWYQDMYAEPPSRGEIMSGVKLSHDRVRLALAALEQDNLVVPGSTMPRGTNLTPPAA